MIKWIFNNIIITAMLLLSSLVYANSGLLFNIVETGSPVAVDVILCLNGIGPLSCQNYHVSARKLAISTTLNYHYPSLQELKY